MLPRSFYDRPVLEVARDLLGRDVWADAPGGVVVARLVEVEAYRGSDDPGSHAFRGQTPRNAVMFGPPGHAYVYFTYGMHWCLNVCCQRTGEAAAVLLRGARIVSGTEVAQARRPQSTERDLARGPARLTQALGLTGTWNGVDLVGGSLRLQAGVPVPDELVRTGPRVGVSGAGAPTPWRFWVAEEAAVSVYRPGVRRVRPRT